jgi:hypothetical protein
MSADGHEPAIGVGRREALAVAGFAIAAAIAYGWPILRNLSVPGSVWDWDFNLGLLWVPYETIVKYHQLPLWNPYECGGMPMWANPQAHLFSPFFPLALIFGPIVSSHLEVVIRIAIGWAGAYILGRACGLGWLGAFTTACCFQFSSWYALRVGSGQFVNFEYVWMPLGFAAALISMRRRSLCAAVFTAVVFALMLAGNAPHAFVNSMLALGILMAGIAVQRWTFFPLAMLVGVGVLVLGLSAIKIVPDYLVYLAHPRITDQTEVSGISVMMSALFSRQQDVFHDLGNGMGFFEGGAYVGLFALPALVGLVRARRTAPWIITAAILYALARGDTPPLALWPWIHAMPVLRSMRIPTRLLIPFVMCVAVIAGDGIDWMWNRGSRWLKIGAIALVSAASIDAFAVSAPIMAVVALFPISPAPPSTAFHYVRLPPHNSILTAEMENTGVIECYEYAGWPTNALAVGDANYRGESYIIGAGSGKLIEWSPNRLTFEVNAPSSARLVVNQNFDPFWTLEHGRGSVAEQNGLLAIDLPAGSQKLTMAYSGWAWKAGAAITLLSILAALWIVRYETFLRRIQSTAADR